MAEFKISRIRYTWRGAWLGATAYNKDDVIRYGGVTYVCVRKHTSSSFVTDQAYLANPGDTDPTPAWLKMTDGYAFRGDWNSSITYAPGDLALYGGVLYICLQGHNSGFTFIANAEKWAEYTTGFNWTVNWQPVTRYGIGDVVKYGGFVYRCIAEHTSDTSEVGPEVGNADSQDDSTGELWETLYEGINYTGAFQTGNYRYIKNDLVLYGGSILRVNEGHVSNHEDIQPQYFDVEFPGYNFRNEWSPSAFYAIGDVVKHGGFLYISNTNHQNINPATSIYDQPQPDMNWSLLQNGIRYSGIWNSGTSYQTGDIVTRGGYLYRALIDTDISADGSTLDYLDASNWEIVVTGSYWRNSWTSGSSYAIGDLVLYRGSTYKCNFQHTSSNDNYPGDNGSGFYYWDIVLLAGPNVALSNVGDILTYGLSRELAGDGSTLGTTNLAIGNASDSLIVQPDNTVDYGRVGIITKVWYVSADPAVALDDDEDVYRGKDPNKPYRTVKFALDRIMELGEDSVLNTVRVAPGNYYEILPMSIPKNVSLVGSELRSTTIWPNKALELPTVDTSYYKEALDRISDIIQEIINRNPITKTVTNTYDQVTTFNNLEKVYVVPETLDAVTGLPIEEDSDILDTAGSDISTRISEMGQYIDFELNSIGSGVTTTALSNEITGPAARNTHTIIRANRNFIAEEALQYVKLQNAGVYTINEARYRYLLRNAVEGFIFDLRYPGNYRSLLNARYYRNLILGSQNDDMFYLRDTTSLKDMTVKGLNGTLNPPNVYELYQLPTGGAFCSLDPGFGPDHSECWIVNRSPYIQNVTTFGDNCVGQKIDGALHNGGVKSIVSNDFTQVISDGVGAWVQNNGRAELVSVFTYYAQIGMFARQGGVIRATNGNSSYGNFGAVADGNDPTETPVYAEVDNRTGQAYIESAFAGEVNDEILILEYRNAGQNYSTANYTFTGSGINANVVHEEIRDDAVFEALVKNAPGDTGATEGGLGYTLLGNNAQEGNTTSLTLASNTDAEESDILGMRLIITSGKGAGQYGYVTAYNTLSKVCQVRKESDDTPGWDHVIPGTPSQPLLFTDNTYRFEPRVTFSEPPFDTSIPNMGQTLNWKDIAYGETKETYTSLQGTVTGGTSTPISATFSAVKNGRTYEVTMTFEGALYEVGQVITISGADVGGVDGEHDIVITVTEVSEDSTNTIAGFRYEGTATSGRFVAVASGTDNYSYTEDGTNWTTATLPSAGNWNMIAAGGHKFVAIKQLSTQAIHSEDGINWSNSTLPYSRNWSGIVYGKSNSGNGDGVFLTIAANLDSAAYSTDGGATWTATTLPDIGDSTFNQWIDVAYGKGKFVAVANSGNFAAVGEYNSNTDTWTWEAHIMDVSDDSSTRDWISVAYGNNRWVAVSTTGDVSYSFNGTDWLAATMPTQDGSTAHYWKKIRYGQGVFFAIGDTGSRDVGSDPTPGQSAFCATSYDGVLWQDRLLSQASYWVSLGFGNPDISLGDSTQQSNSTPMFITVADNFDHACKVETGCRALGRAIVESGSVQHIRLWETGSGYKSNPTVTLTDPNVTDPAYVEIRLGDAALAQPGWINRGSGYRTSTTQVTILGDGFADVIPEGKDVVVSGFNVLPGPGTQFRFRGDTVNYYTVATSAIVSRNVDGTYVGTFRISPELKLDDYLEHTSQVEIRERYSQVRISGHDFLDVGTGNFTETNYPTIYSTGEFNSAPENEVVEANGGRVFYTSTDQSGNFRCGELFAVEQATGIVTISADFFDLGGLTELALGGVRLGGSGTVIREFSTDPAFTQDSNNVIPTQRAIKAYLQNRLNVGGSDLLTASFIAGTVKVGPNLMDNVASLEIKIPVRAEFIKGGQISGSMLAQTMFYDSFND